MLTVTGLTKTYVSGRKLLTIFNNLSLHIDKAEVVSLLGTSGSGKTTLLNLLSGIDTPDSGQVKLDEVDIHAQGEPGRTLLRRQQLGFVFQFFNLIPTLTVGENIALPLQLIGTDKQQSLHRVNDLLRQVGLPDMIDRYPETLSGGEQQRTAIARALAHQPKILLADEPTGNLDEETGASIISLLTCLARNQGTTLLIVTHSHAVAKASDRILRLQHGELVNT